MTRFLDTAAETAAGAAGRLLSGATHALSAARRAPKPLHPEGRLHAGRLVREGSTESTGVPWLDEPGEDDALVRVSRAIGLPGPVPDVHGLALRVRVGEASYADLLLATTGWDPLTRHLLVPGWTAGRPLTTLLPYRSPVGPVVLGARASGEDRYRLSWARVGRGWRSFAELRLVEPLPAEDDVSFDPVLNLVPGLEQYPWVVRLRERSYAAARADR